MYLTTPLDDPAAWRGADMARSDDWLMPLNAAHVAELEAAVERVEQQGTPLYEVTQSDFPLPILSRLLLATLDELEGGRGFVIFRGLPTNRWSEEESRLALWGIGTHLGWAEQQDRAGSLMHDVRDIGRKFGSDDSIRYYQTSQAIDFHNDGADIFALFCIQKGRSGGRSLLLSAVEVFNEVARRRPDLAGILQQDFYVDARGQRQDGARCQVIPVYTYHNGLLSINLKIPYIESAQRFEEVPRLTSAQREALDLLNEVMQDEELILEFDLQPGDLLVASNHVVLHGRTAYADEQNSDRQRHMLRLWLTIPNGRPLPPHYADTREFGATYTRRIGAPSDVKN